jgi:hypothetical protein
MSTTARRRFLTSLAAAPLLPAAALIPQVPPPAAVPEPTPTPSPSPSASPGGPSAAALALTEAVRHRFGAALTAEDLAEVAAGIDGNLQAAARLRERLRQGNADEPVTLFEARPSPHLAPPAPAPARARRRRTRR